MTVQLKPPKPSKDAVHYPESDGKPMAESDLHREIMVYIIHLLQRWLRGQQVYVSGNLLLYYEEGNPRKVVAPDCFVVWGVPPQRRLISTTSASSNAANAFSSAAVGARSWIKRRCNSLR